MKFKLLISLLSTFIIFVHAHAEQGDADAQGNLGVMYVFGKGVIKDFVYAHMWGNIASMNGNDKGETLRGYVAEKMTSSQIEEAQRLAREFIKKNYKGC